MFQSLKSSSHEKVNVANVSGSYWYSCIFIPNESKEREVLDQIWNCPSDLFSLFYKFIMQIVLIDSFHSFENG